MKILLLKVALIFVILLPLTYLSKRWDNSIKVIVIIIAAIGVVFTDFIVDLVGGKLSIPKVEIKAEKNNNELLLTAITSKPLEFLAIDIPILGTIKNIHDNNSVTDARTTIKKIVGSNTQMSQNNIEFYIENIRPTVKIEYKILYEPMPKNIFIAGTDRYNISYAWLYNGEQKTITKWISIETGQEVEKPNIIVRGAKVFNRALSPEEIKKLYEEGLKEQKIDN